MRGPLQHSVTAVCGWAEGRLTDGDGIRARRSGDGLPNGKRDRSAEARDRGWGSELVITVITGVIACVGRGDAGPCSHGGIVAGQGVAELVANGDGADAERARGSRSSSRGDEVQHGVGDHTRGRAIVIATDDAARSRRRWIAGRPHGRGCGGQAAARRAAVDGAKLRGGRDAEAAAGSDGGSSASGAGADAPSRDVRWGARRKNVEATLAEARTASDRRGERRRHAALTL